MANVLTTPSELAGALDAANDVEDESIARGVAPAAIVDALFDEPAPAVAPKAFEPRKLTAEARKKVGLPPAVVPAYRFGFIALLDALAVVPMLMLGWYKTSAALVLVSLVILPAIRWYERREIALRDRVYTHGREVVGRVLDVEPGGPDRGGKIVRVQFMVATGDTPKLVSSSVFGCPLARRGLEPGDDVVIYFDEADPMRCLIADRVARSKPKKVVRRPQGGCGNGGCGNGACGGGGCGGGGCGGGGCGGCAH